MFKLKSVDHPPKYKEHMYVKKVLNSVELKRIKKKKENESDHLSPTEVQCDCNI